MRVGKFSALAGAIVALVVAASAADQADVKVGDPAPDFSLIGSDGRTYRLADYKDKQAVVLAWFAKAFTSG